MGHEIPIMQMYPITQKTKSATKVHGFSETNESEFIFHALNVYFRGPMFKPGGLSENDMMAGFRLEPDVSALFPYLNAVARRAELHQRPHFIRFLYEDRFCVLYSRAGLVTPVVDRVQAQSFLERLILFLNDISSRRHEITPNHRIHRRVSVLNILKLLPKTNCGQCGYASCMAFAASLSLQESVPEKCPHIQSPLGEQAFYPVYDAKGKLVSTVAININTARIGALQNATKESSNPNAAAPLEMDSENVEKANMSLPMPLSSRELEVLCILAEGTSNNEISRMLDISPHTVKSHVIHIFNKLGVNDRTQAAVWAARHHLI
jgi:DNA-binding CsgD family transcriptional regulator/ArsR family metal-binding transcriptional regulator